MSIVASVAILTVAAFAASGGEAADTVYATQFGYQTDRNFDRWPDGWTRARGPRYPHYVEMGIVPHGNDRLCFEIALDGGAAVAFAPEFAPDSDHSYTVEAEVATAGLRHDGCWLSIAFKAADGRTLATAQTEPLRGTQSWTTLTLANLNAPAESAAALVGIHLEPLGERQDLSGTVHCRSLVVRQRPRLELRTSAPFHLHRAGELIDMSCRVRGVDADRTADDRLSVRWELLDPQGHIVHTHQQRAAWKDADLFVPQTAGLAAGGMVALPGTFTSHWQAPRLQPGYYRLAATLTDGQAELARHETSLAVLAAHPRPSHGTFCWTLPAARYRDELAQLTPIFRQAGIQRIKLPLWLAADDIAEQDRMAEQIEKLAIQGIHVTGLIADPPQAVREKLGWTAEVNAVELLLKPADEWFPSLAPAMTRLAVSVPKWQLGRDRERYVAEFADLNDRVAAIKKQAQWQGLDIDLGLAWDWLERPAPADDPPWSFLVYSASPPLAADELPGYLNRALPEQRRQGNDQPRDRHNGKPVWRPAVGCEVVIEPLDRRYELTVRLADLVQRMVVSLQHGVEGVVVPDPFHPTLGLCQPDGLPTELFVPWRTTSYLLGGSRYLGSITLPGGSTNAVFERDGQMVMVLWNERPTTEQIYLGEHPRQYDVWGRSTAVPVAEATRVPAAWRYRHVPPIQEQAETVQEHRIEVGPVPTFVVGLDPVVTRARIGLQLARWQLPAEFGRNQENAVRLENPFSEDVSGRVMLVAPDRWRIRPGTIDVQLAPGEMLHHPFAMRPPFNANDGRQLLAFDFDVTADRRYQFRAYRELIVGADGLELTLFTWLDQQGNLVVEQRLSQPETNRTAFQCNLSAPGRRMQVYLAHGVGPEPQVHRYILPRGSELLGRPITVRLEEQGGRQRVMQKRIVAEP